MVVPALQVNATKDVSINVRIGNAILRTVSELGDIWSSFISVFLHQREQQNSCERIEKC